jgi:hypothetical protein
MLCLQLDKKKARGSQRLQQKDQAGAGKTVYIFVYQD